MAFDSKLAKQVQADAQKALETIAKKYGITIKSNGGTLGMNDFAMKFKVELVGVTKKYDKYIFSILGLPEDIIGRSFIANGKSYEIIELAPNRPKYPVIAKTADGKQYKFTVDTVKFALKIK